MKSAVASAVQRIPSVERQIPSDWSKTIPVASKSVPITERSSRTKSLLPSFDGSATAVHSRPSVECHMACRPTATSPVGVSATASTLALAGVLARCQVLPSGEIQIAVPEPSLPLAMRPNRVALTSIISAHPEVSFNRRALGIGEVDARPVGAIAREPGTPVTVI